MKLSNPKICVCHFEPRGNYGLEGYSRGEKYWSQEVAKIDGKKHMRVWPPTYANGLDVGEFNVRQYYETCSRRAFEIFFKEVKDGK